MRGRKHIHKKLNGKSRGKMVNEFTAVWAMIPFRFALTWVEYLRIKVSPEALFDNLSQTLSSSKEMDIFPILSTIEICLSNSFTLCSSLSHSGGSRLLFVMKFFFNFFLSTSHSKCCCILDFPFGYALSEEIYCQIIVKMKSCKQLEGKRYA